ncbi:MAG: hypothetical protein RRY55_09100 [Bacteroidales bacterium]
MFDFILSIFGYIIYTLIILGGVGIAIWMISTLFEKRKKGTDITINIHFTDSDKKV